MASKLHNGCLQRRGTRWSLKGIMMCITTCQEQVRHVVMSTLLTAGIRAVRVCWSPLNTGTRSCLDRLASMSAPLPPSSPNGRFIEIGNAILNEPKYRVLKELIFVALSHTFAYKIACCFLGCFRVPEPVPELEPLFIRWKTMVFAFFCQSVNSTPCRLLYTAVFGDDMQVAVSEVHGHVF